MAEYLTQKTLDGIQSELELLIKKVIIKSEGNDVLTIQLLGQIKQVFRDMSRTIIESEKQYGEKA